MLTTGAVSNEKFVVSSNSSQFPLMNSSVFTASSEVKQQSQPGQQVQQTQGLIKQEPSIEGIIPDHLTSSTNTLLSNQFSALFPSTVSLNSRSPVDSVVVTDSKLAMGNASQDLLLSQESDRLKLSPNSMKLSGMEPGTATDPIVSGFSTGNMLNLQDSTTEISKIHSSSANNLGLSPSKVRENNCVTISPDLATIWSPPTVEDKTTGFDPALQSAMLQALQQQQSIDNWNESSVGAPTKPPPGLTNIPLLQKHPQAQASGVPMVNGLQQKFPPLRRSKSVMVNRTNMFNSASLLPGPNDAYDALSDHLLSANFSTDSFSPWSSANSSLPAPSLSTLATLNAAQLRAGAGSPLSKLSLASQLVSPPKFHRSISTPAQHTTPYNLAHLNDNPYLKSNAVPGLNGHVSMMGSTNALNFSEFESTLNEIMKSNATPKHPFLQAHQSTRGLGKWKELTNDTIYEESLFGPSFSIGSSSFLGEMGGERYSRKVFVGGLPPDIDEDEIRATFIHFGSLVVDWPHKAESKSYFPPKGYAFLLFKEEMSVQNLIRCCLKEGDKLYLRVSSPTIRDKPVQIRPWKLTDSDFVLDGSQSLDPRKTVFVGGVPRPLRAFELAVLMDQLYGGVCYAGIDVDPDLKYPKGAGRVAFSNQQSYIAAISARFAHLQHGDIDKRVEVKPYVLDDQHCDECQGTRCGGRFAPFFCANIACLRYYCDQCWVLSHNQIGMESHRPLVKEGAERFARSAIGRW